MPIDPSLLAAYLIACLVLIATPGPDMAFALAQTLAGGARRGWWATAGIVAGALTHTALAALGVAALIAANPLLFDALRIAGAVYLLWLGVQALRVAFRPAAASGGVKAEAPRRSAFLQGYLTNLLNPKVALFFLAFLPQFVAPDRAPAWLQMLILGPLLPLLSLPVFWLLIGTANRAKGLPGLGRAVRWIEGTAGAIFLGLGIRLLAGR